MATLRVFNKPIDTVKIGEIPKLLKFYKHSLKDMQNPDSNKYTRLPVSNGLRLRRIERYSAIIAHLEYKQHATKDGRS